MVRRRLYLPGFVAALALGGCDQSAQRSTGQVDASGTAFAPCQSCHSAEKDGGSRVGPNLYGVVGRKAGTVADYRYSPAMRNSGIVWTADTLDRFLAAPAQTVPGTRMGTSVPDAARRRAVIAYLNGLTK